MEHQPFKDVSPPQKNGGFSSHLSFSGGYTYPTQKPPGPKPMTKILGLEILKLFKAAATAALRVFG